jgi:hypothetical protein
MERRDRVSEDKEHDGLDESATDKSGAGNDWAWLTQGTLSCPPFLIHLSR